MTAGQTPRPSQDAEGDGRNGSPETPWVRLPSVVNRTRLYGRTNGSGREDRHQISESLAVAIESAIREPYEALVREQAETYHGLVCADRLSNWPTRFEDCPESACRKATAALARIEESQGGRE